MKKSMKNLVSLTAVLVALFGVTGCSQSSNEAETAQPSTSQVEETTEEVVAEEATTMVITHDLGETEVNINPKNVVAFDYGVLDALDYMGVEVTGLPKSGTLPAHLSKFSADEYQNAGSLKEVDLEAVYEMQPELIVISGRQSDYYDELSNIAPTIYMGIDNTNYLESFKENMTVLGQIFGKEEFVSTELEKIEAKVAELNEEVTALGVNALITLVNDASISAYGQESRFGIIHNTFGFLPVDENIETSTHGQNVSFEYILEKNPDYLFVVDRGAVVGGESSAKALLDNELVNATSASANDQIIYLDPVIWYTAGGGFTSTLQMIEEVHAAIQK